MWAKARSHPGTGKYTVLQGRPVIGKVVKKGDGAITEEWGGKDAHRKIFGGDQVEQRFPIIVPKKVDSVEGARGNNRLDNTPEGLEDRWGIDGKNNANTLPTGKRERKERKCCDETLCEPEGR